ncbi:hypothetical protein N7457_003173 [Penicillium paradoxum]|uniref:uncharacterized protein n=1 Tax=Penicillium paradoxum TaxID=176176 RepID=UPI002549378D|nr:uncharacterized protein N7457_003173 [Penicillium paradoxum]KAJ5788183.1 hypothetical protein N7457_003173 [Penicillium paradoxum]
MDENQSFQMELSPPSHCDLWQAPTPQPISRHQLPTEGLQWGSDPNFGYHGFSCPIGTWTEERVVQNLLRNIVNLCTSMDVGPDIPDIEEPIPKHISDPMQLNGWTIPIFQPAMIPTDTLSEMAFSPSSSSSSSPSQAQSQTSPEDPECTRRASCAKAATTSGQKKRKCVQKPGQNLCHCRSEKKRREIIGERYKQLCHVVPGLENHSYTRKYVLREAALWIQELLRGNDVLHQQLAQLKEQEKVNRVRLFPVEEDETPAC